MQMGKIRSAIITAIVALATLALFFFGVVSFDLPGNIDRYNSILANIGLGSELSGDVYTVLLPEGVISAAEYDSAMAEEGAVADEYAETYVEAPGGAYYVDKEVLDAESDQQQALKDLAAKISEDAQVLAGRFANRNLTSYSVGVLGGYGIRVAVPSGYDYATYAGYDLDSRSVALNASSSIIGYLSRGGEFTLRNNDYGSRDAITSSQLADDSQETYNILGDLDAKDAFKSVKYFAMGGVYGIRIKLTAEGRERLSEASAAIADTAQSSDQTIRFYVGEDELIPLTCESEITSASFDITVGDEETARSYAALFDSAAGGNALNFSYDYDDVYDATVAGGENTAVFLAVSVLVLFVAVVAFAIARYRLLGLTFSMTAMLFSGVMIAVTYLVGVTLTATGVFTAVLALALFAGCNFWSFEQIRRESDAGRTLQAAVKTGYKKTFSGILDLHVVLFVVSVLLTLVCRGALSACGMILLIGTLASYILHWFTRFMWYVTMSPARDKYKFCGFSREAFDNYE